MQKLDHCAPDTRLRLGIFNKIKILISCFFKRIENVYLILSHSNLNSFCCDALTRRRITRNNFDFHSMETKSVNNQINRKQNLFSFFLI